MTTGPTPPRPSPEDEDAVVLPGWLNWRKHNDGVDAPIGTYEVALHTDARVTGDLEAGAGPYMLLNTVMMAENPRDAPAAIVLRIDEYPMPGDRPRWDRTDTSNYHGGAMDEELASLISLALGIRCRTGGMTREFRPGGDPRGRPTGWATRPPYLPPPRERGPLLPQLRRVVALPDALSVLSWYPSCRWDAAQVLVKAARLYQEAVWGADANPNAAWLQLVSALEVAAVHWYTDTRSPLDHIRAVKPHWAEALAGVAPDEPIVEELAKLIKATVRFAEFTLAHLPEPPAERPPPMAQVDWDRMKHHLFRIYDLRSAALHTGTPFPVPMMEAPWKHDEWSAGAEKPLGEGTFAAGGRWTAKDTPMNLATFEYIARGALLNWWRSLATER